MKSLPALRLSNGWILALISAPVFIGALDLTVVSAVLPQVVYDLQIPQTEINLAAWIVTGYLLAYTVAMAFMGRLSDLVGRRKVYLGALLVFALGSLLVAQSDGWLTRLALRVYYQFGEGRPDPARVSLYILIAARMIQALGGGAMVPVSMALCGDLYPDGLRARPLGVIAAIDTAGWVVGHLYGGVLTRFFDWRLIFWLNLPLCLISFVLIYAALRGLPGTRSPGRMDWPGALFISAFLITLTLGLGGGETSAGLGLPAAGAAGTLSLPLLGVAALCLAFFLWRQVRAENPLIALSLLRAPNFGLAGLANFLIGFALFVAIANVPIFINTLVAPTLAQAAWDSGWMLSGLTVPMALASAPGGWWAARRGYRGPALAGLALSLAGFAWMTTWTAATPYAAMLPHLALAGIGLGLTLAFLAAAAINAAPEGLYGAASGLVIVFRLIGMTSSVAVIAAFDQQRFNALSAELLNQTQNLAKAGTDAITLVIHETFWIAAAAAGLAIVPIFFLKSEGRMKHE
jgi:MFS family permease